MSRTPFYRQVTKPLLEKMRRQRITNSVEDLRNIVNQARAPEDNQFIGKLEKADILEMAVKMITRLQQQAGALDSNAARAGAFNAGYDACLVQLSFFMKGGNADPTYTAQMLHYLYQVGEQVKRHQVPVVSHSGQPLPGNPRPPLSAFVAQPPPPPLAAQFRLPSPPTHLAFSQAGPPYRPWSFKP